MLSIKRFQYIKGLLMTTSRALDGYMLSKEQFDELSPINQQLWSHLTAHEPVPEAIPKIVETVVEDPKLEEVKPDAPTETSEAN